MTHRLIRRIGKLEALSSWKLSIEAERGLAVWQSKFIRLAWVRRLSWFCRSDRRRRLRLRDKSNGDAVNRRPARRGAQRRTLLRHSGFDSRALKASWKRCRVGTLDGQRARLGRVRERKSLCRRSRHSSRSTRWRPISL
jgi:hypothetical protein